MNVDLQALCEQFHDLKPPQFRDRLIFEAVAVEQRPQTEVAREYGISQPRVAQIVAEVGLWASRVLPAALDGISSGQRLSLANFLVESRLDYLREELMAAWNNSREARLVVKHLPQPDGTVLRHETTVPQGGKVGFLNFLLRVVLAQSRLAGVDVSGRSQRMAALAEAAARNAAGVPICSTELCSNPRSETEAGLVKQPETEQNSNLPGAPTNDPGEAEKELIGQSEIPAADNGEDLSQDETLSRETRFRWTLEQEREVVVNGLMKEFRQGDSPSQASDEELRRGCEMLWEQEFRAKSEEFHRMKYAWFPRLAARFSPIETLAAEEPAPPAPPEEDSSPSRRLPRGELRRLRRDWERSPLSKTQRRRAQVNRREFLAPLAAG